MDTSLERIRAKIAELEAKLADLRIAERELVALGPAPARKSTAARTPKVKPKRKGKGPSPASPTIGAAIAEVLHEHGALAVTEIAEQIKAGKRFSSVPAGINSGRSSVTTIRDRVAWSMAC
jgi:hypothetical protein